MFHLRSLLWILSMCFTVFLCTHDTTYQTQDVALSFADLHTDLNFDLRDNSIFYSEGGNFLTGKNLVNHRRRTQDRNCGFSLGILHDKIDISSPPLLCDVPVILPHVNNVCLSSCYNFIFRLSPF